MEGVPSSIINQLKDFAISHSRIHALYKGSDPE